MAAPFVAPMDPAQAQAAAEATLANLFATQGQLAVQLQADIATVKKGWATLDAATQTAIMGRILAGFGTVMEALTAQLTVANSGVLP